MTKYKRQTLLFDPQTAPETTVVVVGLGNIGSHVSLLLARLGVSSIALYDPDKVEIHNVASQAYTEAEVGILKTDAIAVKIRDINPECNILAIPKKFTGKEHILRPPSILIIGVDSMKERQKIHGGMRKNYFPNLVVDGRIGGNQLEVYCCSTWDSWKETFVEKASQDPCGGRYICYVSSVIAGVIVNNVKRHIQGQQLVRWFNMHMDTLDILK